MDIALIAPYSYLDVQDGLRMQMMLPVGLDNENYSSRYMTWGKDPSKYVILDNGMFEGNALPTGQLLDIASRYHVDEIVMPDKQANGYESLLMQKNFYAHWNAQAMTGTYDTKLMAVVQGGPDHIDRIAEWSTSIPGRITLGFPRRMTERKDQAYSRLEQIEYTIRKYGKQFEIHMLGMSRRWPGEVLAAARQFGPYIRSMDTSAPWVYAAKGLKLPTNISEIVDREDDYFTADKSRYPILIVSDNLEILDGWSKSVRSGL
jgi:hypothetical protein